MAWNPTLKINLLKVFNGAYSDKPSKLKDQLRNYISMPEVKGEFSREVINVIIDRTLAGIDKNGDEFMEYSKSYKKSINYRIYGKTSRVNLRLTGSMLSSMDYTRSDGYDIVFYFNGQKNRDKAQGHTSGLLGKNDGFKRDFLGLPESELERILKDVIRTKANENFQNLLAKNGEFLQSIGSNLTVGNQAQESFFPSLP